MSGINIDDLQREISAAESYLKRVPSGSRPSADVGLRDSRGPAPPSDDEGLEEASGRNSDAPERIGTDIMELNKILLRSQKEEEVEKPPEPPMDYLNPSALSGSMGSRSTREGHSFHGWAERAGSTPSPASKATPGKGLSPYVNKYDDPAERDKLIAKLLAEHADKSASKTAAGMESRSPQTMSPSRVGHKESSFQTSPTRHIGRYHLFQEQQKSSQGSASPSRFSGQKLSTGKYASASGSSPSSYSAAYEAERSSSSGGSETGYQYKGSDELVKAYQDTADDTLFFASDIDGPASPGAIEEGSGDDGGNTKTNTTSATDNPVIIYGSYEGDEDSELYAVLPDAQADSRNKEGGNDMMATAKAVHSSAEGGLRGDGKVAAATQVALADQQQAEISKSIPVLAKSESPPSTSGSASKDTPSASAGAASTIPRKKSSGPPSRLVEPQPKQWKYLKSKEACEEEGKSSVARGGQEGGKYSFKPTLSAKVRREKARGKATKPSVVHAMFNNLPLPQAADESKGDEGEDCESDRPKFELERFEESVRQHQRNVDARARLKQHVENVEVQSYSFRPKISRKAQELADQAKVQQLQLLQEERIASRYFGSSALPKRLDPHSVGVDILRAGLPQDVGLSVEDPSVTVEPNNPFNHLEEDSEGNLIYNEALDDMYASHLGEQVSERLHKEAQTRADQQRWLEQQVREARAAEYPFQPAITSEANKHYDKLKKEYGVAHVPIHERVAELQKFKQKRLQDLRAAREEEEGRTNTYNPHIDKKSREIAERRRKEEEMKRRVQLEEAVALEQQGGAVDGGAQGPGEESVHPHRFDKFTSAIARALVDSNNDNNGTANSGLASTTAAAMSGFFHDSNAEEVLRNKEFQNAVSEDVESRLMKEGRATEMKMMYLQVMREKEIEEQTQQAQPSKGTEKLAAQSSFVGASFAERQRMYREKVEQRQAQRQMRVEQTASKWFNPKIGRSTSVLAASKPERVVETKDERVQRLSVRDAEEKEIHRAQMTEFVYRDVTFKPKLTRKTEQLGRVSTLEDLVDDPKGHAVRDAVRRRVQEEQQKDHTFHPTIPIYRPEHGDYEDVDRSVSRIDFSYNSAARGRRGGAGEKESDDDAYDPIRDLYGADLPSRQGQEHQDQGRQEEAPYMQSHYGQTYGANDSTFSVPASVAVKQQINMREPDKMARNIKHDLQRKEEHRRSEIIRTELKELKECTFQPQITVYPGSAPEGTSNVIKGLDRHLELKELTARKKEEQKEREEEVFGVKNVDSMRRVEDGTTVTAPFHLSESDSRPSRAVLELREKEKEELTFQPATENIKRRNQLRKAVRSSTATEHSASDIYKTSK